MGVADTSWVIQRKRISQPADILLTCHDMDDRTLHLREENCVWTLEDEETAEEREIKAVPDYLWTAAKYIESVGNWQETASELLAAAGIEDAKPNQFTYNMAKYFDKVCQLADCTRRGCPHGCQFAGSCTGKHNAGHLCPCI